MMQGAALGEEQPWSTRRSSALLSASSQKSLRSCCSFFLFWISNNAFTKPGPNYHPLPNRTRSNSPMMLQSGRGRQLVWWLRPRARRAPSPAPPQVPSHTQTPSGSLVQCRTAHFCDLQAGNQDGVQQEKKKKKKKKRGERRKKKETEALGWGEIFKLC